MCRNTEKNKDKASDNRGLLPRRLIIIDADIIIYWNIWHIESGENNITARGKDEAYI
ncbi:hypothetical protein ATG_17490 [Desulfurococcaceae archaeon AG1]|nr:hypothetical protein ATG_17490 [Desulfurococcaceae archaeon AG1]